MYMSGIASTMMVVFSLLGIVAFIAWLYSIYLFVDIAQKKGHVNTGPIWFIGIFATPIVAGLYVLMLEDKKGSSASAKAESGTNELPSI